MSASLPQTGKSLTSATTGSARLNQDWRTIALDLSASPRLKGQLMANRRGAAAALLRFLLPLCALDNRGGRVKVDPSLAGLAHAALLYTACPRLPQCSQNHP
jgi:hypothetical protein